MRKPTVIVVGSGIAGMYFSLKAAAFAEVRLISKDEFHLSNSTLAQGGIAAVLDSTDHIEKHVQDTLIAGDGLCNEDAVRLLASKAAACIHDLLSMGVPFNKSLEGDLHLAREGGHSSKRIVHVADHTGLSVAETLMMHVKMHPNIQVHEHCFALDLHIENGQCKGLHIWEDEAIHYVPADAVVLACGGAGQMYLLNTNPPSATADGFAMAFRAGARLSDMEFVQFHPTMLYQPGAPAFLISEAVRGFGAELINEQGEAFMQHYHPKGALAPRDIVSRGMVQEMQKTGADHVYLDVRQFEQNEVRHHFPTIYKTCLEYGINPAEQPIPVTPAAHYMCGGIVTDLDAQTSIPGLFAIGENACTGVHGANRLASNSLLECLVFAQTAAERIRTQPIHPTLSHNVSYPYPTQEFRPLTAEEHRQRLNHLQGILWQQVGIIRRKDDMQQALQAIRQMLHEMPPHSANRATCELFNLMQTAQLVCEAALARTDNVGAHFCK